MSVQEFIENLQNIVTCDDATMTTKFSTMKDSIVSQETILEEKLQPIENFPIAQSFFKEFDIKAGDILNHYESLNDENVIASIRKFHSVVQTQIFPEVSLTSNVSVQCDSVLNMLQMEGLVVRFKPTDTPAWCNGDDKPTLKVNLSVLLPLKEEVEIRSVISEIKNTEFIARHRRTAFHFGTDSPIMRMTAKTLVLTMWIDIDKTTSMKTIRFGTSYTGDKFPFEEASILPLLMPSSKIPPPSQLRSSISKYLDFLKSLKEIYGSDVITSLMN